MNYRLQERVGCLKRMGVLVGLVAALSGALSSAATATSLSVVGTFPQSSAVWAEAPTQSDQDLLVRASLSTVAPTSELFAVPQYGTPTPIATVPYVYGAAISPNGRYEAWADAPCDRIANGPTHPISFDVFDTSLPGATPQLLTVPRRYQHARVEALSISSGGRITALLSTYTSDCYAFGVFTPRPGDGAAIVSATPGVGTVQVVASAVLYAGSAPSVTGAAYTLGDVAASPHANNFVLCYLPRIHARTANLVEVINGDPLTIRRISAPTDTADAEPQCAASDAGTATMLLSAHNSQRFVSIGGGLRHQVRARGHGAFFGLSLSPSGRVVTDGGLVSLTTGRQTPEPGPAGYNAMRNSLNVPATNGLAQFDPFDQFGDFNSVVGWVTPNQILTTLTPNNGVGRGYLLLLNLLTGRWSQRLYFENVAGQHFATYCGLPSGRVLLAIGTDTGYGLPDVYRLFLSDAATTGFRPVDTSALGGIHAISCPIPAQQVYVSVGNSPSLLLAASASGIDGSAWTG